MSVELFSACIDWPMRSRTASYSNACSTVTSYGRPLNRCYESKTKPNSSNIKMFPADLEICEFIH